MSEAGFYDLQGRVMARTLPLLLERVVSQGMKAVVRLPDDGQLAEMNKALWHWGGRGGGAFLAHAAQEDGLSAEDIARQPVWLTCAEENPNKAQVLVLVGDAAPFGDDMFSRCLFMFDGGDPATRTKALAAYQQWAGQARWHEASANGWQQTDPNSTP